MRIELARPEDAAAVTTLLERSALPTDGWIDHLGTTLVARDDDGVVGSAALEMYPDGALLRSVAVDATRRGRGLGVDLTNAALDLARARGIAHVFLLTTTAEHFFPRFGFAPIAREAVPAGVRQSVEFTSACPSSAVVMRRSA